MSSAKLTPTTNSHPCPICDDTKGKCRHGSQGNGYVQCMDFVGVGISSIPLGYKYLGDTKCGTWGQFVEQRDTKTQAEWEARKEERRKRREAEEAEQKRRYEDGLTNRERDVEIRKLSKFLGLVPAHRQALQERGFTDTQIERYGFFSLHKAEPIGNAQIDPKLPGVSVDASILSFWKDRGIGCPIFDLDGRMVGYQCRLDGTTEGKYRWASGTTSKRHNAPTSHLQNGELPIGVYRPDEMTRPGEVWLTEGAAIKPTLAALKLGAVTIGAAGGNFRASKQQLAEYLAKLEPQRVVIAVDAGGLDNPHVRRQIEKNVELVRSLGYEVMLGWWGQTDKATGRDLDELTPDQIESIEYRNPEQLLAEQNSRIQKRWEKDWGIWQKRTSLDANEQTDDEFFEYRDPAPKEILLIKSALATGKTTWFLDLLKNTGRGAIIITTRNALLLDIGGKAKKLGLPFYHYQTDIKSDRLMHGIERNSDSIIAVCPDSLIHLNPYDFENKFVIIDELESVRTYFATANTSIAKNRSEIISKFTQILKLGHATIGLDGLLSNQSVEWLNTLTGRQPNVVENLRKNSTTYKFYDATIGVKGKINRKNPNKLIGDIIIGLGEGEKYCIATDSQRKAEQIERQVRKVHSDRDLNILRIDSKTSGEQWIGDFLKDPDEFIARTKPDLVIFTPTVEAGFDISIKNYFDKSFGLYMGVIRPQQIVQQMGRCRYPKDPIRHLYVALTGLNNDHKLNPAVVLRNQCKWMPRLGDEAEDDIYNVATQYLIDSYKDHNPPSHLLGEFVSSILNKNTRNIREVTTAIFEMENLRACVKNLLERAGHTIESYGGLDTLDTVTFKQVKAQVKAVNARDIFNAKDISIEEAKELKQAASEGEGYNWKAKCKVKKAELKDKLPGIEDTESWSPELIEELEEDRALTSKATLRMAIAHPIELMEKWDAALWAKRFSWLENSDERTFDPIGYRSLLDKVKAYKALPLEPFTRKGFTWDKDSPEVKALWSACKSKKVQRSIGVKWEYSPMSFVGNLLKKMGIATQSERAKDGDRRRTYRHAPEKESPYIADLMMCLYRRYSDVESIQIDEPKPRDIHHAWHPEESMLNISESVQNFVGEWASDDPDKEIVDAMVGVYDELYRAGELNRETIEEFENDLTLKQREKIWLSVHHETRWMWDKLMGRSSPLVA